MKELTVIEFKTPGRVRINKRVFIAAPFCGGIDPDDPEDDAIGEMVFDSITAISDRYLAGETVNKICREWRICRNTLLLLMKALGVPLRTRGGRQLSHAKDGREAAHPGASERGRGKGEGK